MPTALPRQPPEPDGELACRRFRGHQDEVFDGAGELEAHYSRVSGPLSNGCSLKRLERKAERQDRAIEAMRCKYRFNVPRPFLPLG